MTTLAIISKGKDEEVRVTLEQFRGRQRIDVRTWFRGEDGKMHPTKQGCFIRPRHLPEFCAGLNKALHALSEKRRAW
ncbi:Transcriptional Coactivator p15 (PC4) [Roseivivax jejudonensis]|uniref:Transcriptional Coactivator p15 (PC4) n=1 Tax=Roseivivax jejudonensis TaxID=1529041 RepID=A0A1X6YK75_9RHOB|nr:transcriptional coactivator p15/PC4 family protein [Roseivivax jejudonensis]SLN23312.1 Transcriptional Coactivator p15 (PC4) [Roseivivax jejudonensis]